MKIDVSWQSVLKFRGETSEGYSLLMDADPQSGGEAKGPRPTEVLLMALGGCMGINVISILNKMRETVISYNLSIDADRAAEQPKRFTTARLLFQLEGDLKPTNAERAIRLSLEKYCSVSNSLNAEMVFAYEINGKRFPESGFIS